MKTLVLLVTAAVTLTGVVLFPKLSGHLGPAVSQQTAAGETNGSESTSISDPESPPRMSSIVEIPAAVTADEASGKDIEEPAADTLHDEPGNPVTPEEDRVVMGILRKFGIDTGVESGEVPAIGSLP